MADGLYNDDFEVSVYLDFFCNEEAEVHDFLLQNLHKFFSAADRDDLKVLDFGCGPTLANHISASSKAMEIVLAEHAKPNRVCQEVAF